ncbi:MAG: hypothetical protein H0T84_10950 [Tatlockia sp.]|nr:hypothetical protein [Tatlockia sp.]
MTFNLRKVADYAQFIGNGVHISPPDNWESNIKMVHVLLNILKCKKDTTSLQNYAQALYNATAYLISKRIQNIEVAVDRQIFIDNHLNFLKQHYREVEPQGKIKPPLPLLEPSDSQNLSGAGFGFRAKALIRQQKLQQLRKEGRENAPELDEFVNSQAFRALDNHLNLVLNEDERDHSFFCFGDFREERKVNVLNQFLTDLKSRSNMVEVKEFLVDFYSKKGKIISNDSKTWDLSPFEILNTGQNITTRFFSIFGMETTTIDLIKKLATSIGYNPDVTEEMNSRPTVSKI